MIKLFQGKNIHKRKFSALVNEKLKQKGYNIDMHHINSIINLLLDEIKLILTSGKKFYIGGFGKFILKEMPLRPFYNYQTEKVEIPLTHKKKLKFIIDKKMRVNLINNINIQETFDTEKTNEKDE